MSHSIDSSSSTILFLIQNTILWQEQPDPLSICPLTSISRDMICLYLAERFQWNLAQIFNKRVEIAENVLKVKVTNRSYDLTVA